MYTLTVKTHMIAPAEVFFFFAFAGNAPWRFVYQAFSKRIRFAIEDLLDLRKNKWAKMLCETVAKMLGLWQVR